MNANTISTPPSLENASAAGCKRFGLVGQFGQPTGFAGWLVGHLMAVKNAALNRAAVEVLDPQPDDRVLEIGFGPGKTIRMISKRLTNGFVAGVDLSGVMVKQAARRNREFVKMGRVELKQGSASSLPYGDGQFGKVCAINAFHHLPEPINALREIRRVLKPGGLVLLGLRMKHPTRTFLVAPGFTQEEIKQVLELLRTAGFGNIRTARRRAGREIICVLANR